MLLTSFDVIAVSVRQRLLNVWRSVDKHVIDASIDMTSARLETSVHAEERYYFEYTL